MEGLFKMSENEEKICKDGMRTKKINEGDVREDLVRRMKFLVIYLKNLQLL